MNENIYVTDQWNHRVQIFSKEGDWIRSVKERNEISTKYSISQPINLCTMYLQGGS